MNAPRMNNPRTAARWGGLAVLLAVGIVAPYMLTSYLVGLLSLFLIAALLASSINLLAQAGLVSLGHAGISAAAGYGLAYVIVRDGSWPLALLTAAAVTVVVGGVFALTSMRTSGIYFLMVTLALGMVVWGMAFRLNRVTNGDNGITGVERPAAVEEYWLFYFVCLAVLALALLALWVINRSPFGLTLRGIRDSESRMRSLGYDVTAHKFWVVMLSGAFAGAAGILGAWHAEFISPASAFFISSALGVIMVILGGAGTLLGPVAGAAVVTGAENILSTYTERWDLILGLLFIAVVLFYPQGIAGIAQQVARRLSRRPAPSRQPPPGPREPERSPTPLKVPSEPPDRH